MDDFRVLLLKLSSEISTEELRSMKFALRDVIPSGIMERLERATDVFNELENMGYLSSSNRELLADVLDKIGRQDLGNKVLGIASPVQGPVHQLIMPTNVIEESKIDSIAEEVSLDWKTLGRELRIREAHLANISQDYRQTREKAFQVVLKWKQINGNDATIDKLMKALIKIGRRDVAELLSESLPTGQRAPSESTDGDNAFMDMSALDPSRYVSSSVQVVVPPTDQKTWTKPVDYFGLRNNIVTDSAQEEISRNITTSEERMPIQVEPLPAMVKLGNYLDPSKYEALKLLGAGSFGKVYLVKRKGLLQDSNYFAVKQVDLGINDEPTKQSVDSLQREMEILEGFDNEYILKVFYLEQGHNTLNLFMEFMSGGSISQFVQTSPVPDSRVQSYTWQILQGLKYLHSKNIIHRDIKGGNILIGSNVERVKIADFGISKNMEVLQKATGTGFKGTKSSDLGAIYWKCPELLKATNFKENCDIWSLGCTVIEMLTQKPPFGDLAPHQALFKILEEGVKPLDGCSPQLSDFLNLCFKDMSERPDAQELLKHSYPQPNF